MGSQNKELNVFDPESGATYKLILDTEDYTRANEDDAYLSSLLFHARTDIAENNNLHSESDTATENVADVEDMEPNKSYIWQYDQINNLIKSMTGHIEDLNHPKKRKQVYENVANDLVSMRYKVNAIMVQNKWNSLIKSYRKAKDMKTRTGRQPTRFNFFDLMDEALGSNPTNSCSHSLASSSPSVSSHMPSTSSDSSIITPSPTPGESDNESFVTPSIKRTKMSEKKIKQEKVYLEKEEAQKKQFRHDERMKLEREKLALETKKMELLEKYLNTRQ